MIQVPPVIITKMELLLAWACDKELTEQRALVESDWDVMNACSDQSRDKVKAVTRPGQCVA